MGGTSRSSSAPYAPPAATFALSSPKITPSLYDGAMTFACLNCYNERSSAPRYAIGLSAPYNHGWRERSKHDQQSRPAA